MAEQVEPEEGRGRTVRQLQRGDVDGVHGDVTVMHAVSRATHWCTQCTSGLAECY